MRLERFCGVLLHPTSLPSLDGIGDFGPGAYAFIDFLEESKQKFWQLLPLGPVGYGESPYQNLSAFAGNDLLLSLDLLVQEGLLAAEELISRPNFPEERIDFSAVKVWKDGMLRKANQRFQEQPKGREYQDFQEENKSWLTNYAFFMALKDYFQGLPWNKWNTDIAFRQERALQDYQLLLQDEINYQYFLQFKFFTQWSKLKNYAHSRGIKIIGDLPIFIAADSSDAWANPHLFALDSWGNPTKVAGVPPDYFSETGQLWGNPHYKWEEMEKDDYFWWRERFSHLLKQVDIIRVDHFRGFEAYWEIPGGEKTAVKGQWVQGPGEKFFKTIREYLGELPIIAEDLGVITPPVEELKNLFQFPGMRVMQFSFNSPKDRREFICNLDQNTVAYTGTHDNDTVLGWYRKLEGENPKTLEFFRLFAHLNPQLSSKMICWTLIAITLNTKANLAIIPLQDILGLDTEARMNLPGTTLDNWQWRFNLTALDEEKKAKLSRLVMDSNRFPQK